MLKLNFDVKRKTLENGLEVLTIKKDTQIASINVGIKVGAMHEDINEKGISHFIEHMLFKGTENRDNEELNEGLEALGGEYNAYTDYDATVYTVSCLGEEIENAINLLGDMITSSNFKKHELERERGVILAEIRSSKDDIEDLSFTKINDIAFDKSPLKYDVTGIEENVKKFNRQDIVEFYKKYYVPSNCTITIVSEMEHNKAADMIEKGFLNWNGKKIEQTKMLQEKNKPVKKISLKSDIEQSTIIYLYTLNDLKKEDELCFRILNHRLGESANSMLFREIREKRGLAYDIYTNLDISNNIKTLYIYTAVAKENIDETVNAIDDLIKNIKDGTIVIGEKDLSLMKKVHKTAVISTLEDSAELCNYILNQELEKEDIFEFVKDMKALETINMDKIQDVAKAVLNNPTIHILTSNEE